MTTDDKAFVTTEDRCSSCGAKLANAETARLTYQGEAHKLGEELERVKKERDECWKKGVVMVDELCASRAELERVKKELEQAKLPTVEHIQDIYALTSWKARAEAAEAKLTKAEACAAEMRNFTLSMHYDEVGHLDAWPSHARWSKLISHSTCGTGYLSPQQVRELVGPLVHVVRYAATVRTDRTCLHDGDEMAMQTVDWCNGLIEAIEASAPFVEKLESLTKGTANE